MYQVEELNRAVGLPMVEPLNGQLGLIPDWQFYPQPLPYGTGKYSDVEWYMPGSCPSYGISGAMGLGQEYFSQQEPGWSDTQLKWMMIAWGVFVIHSMLRLPLAVVDGAHGYKRNHGSGASAAAWGALGFLAPLTTTTVALFQGYGKPKD